jgi:hypothetical protein
MLIIDCAWVLLLSLDLSSLIVGHIRSCQEKIALNAGFIHIDLPVGIFYVIDYFKEASYLQTFAQDNIADYLLFLKHIIRNFACEITDDPKA